MVLTKLKSETQGFFEYVNLENVETIVPHGDYYTIIMTSGNHIEIALDEVIITNLVNSA